MVWVIGVVIVIFLLIIFIINRQFANALSEIIKAIVQLESGNYDIKLNVHISPELN